MGPLTRRPRSIKQESLDPFGVDACIPLIRRKEFPNMAKDIKIVSVSIPTKLVQELDRVCDLEFKNRSELYREALRQFLKLRRWQKLREYSTAKAAAAGADGVDLEAIIAELTV